MALRKNLDLSQTIFALATGSLPSAVAIEKLSGPAAFKIANKLFLPSGESFSQKRAVWFGTLQSPDGKKIDDVVVVTFVGPHSHTGEDTVEFHCHGSRAIIQKLERALLNLGARPAGRGEFSYRAMLNGKQNAADLENLADIFQAKQSIDLERVYARKDGILEKRLAALRSQLIGLQAILDTAVDFSEEYSSVVDHAEQALNTVIHECSAITQSYLRFKQAEAAPKIVIAGRPNAGKSSLFNGLLGRYRAIVSSEAGTTRDVIEEDVEFNGRRWKLVDTAGMRESQSTIEQEGISLGENFLASASLWILVVDGTEGISPKELDLVERFGSTHHFIVWNKSDLAGWKQADVWLKGKTVEASALTGDHLEHVWSRLEADLEKMNLNEVGPLPTAVQASRLEVVTHQLLEMKKALKNGHPPEVLAELNRSLILNLESVLGVVENEEVLGRIFSEFCIGK